MIYPVFFLFCVLDFGFLSVLLAELAAVEEKPQRVMTKGKVSSRDHLDGEEGTGSFDVSVIAGTTDFKPCLYDFIC